ncbi:hypothetical protein B0T11DRAFT_6657 [Plectosphaerella cucumerina]|uniref:Uncharacterized protein n=1 Tax=Plectosphaerella cucumerina TaxID=40658 RepID=A0A8K0TUS2_9PEZI|nr:hypothetical protein B0T11DRAFT_6657 [Plectosphaerella cucumerina]
MLPSLTNQHFQQKPQDPHLPCPVRGPGDTDARPPRSSNEPRRRADTAPYDIGQPKIQAPVAPRPQHQMRCEDSRGGSASEFFKSNCSTTITKPDTLRLADGGIQVHFKEPSSLHEFEFSHLLNLMAANPVCSICSEQPTATLSYGKCPTHPRMHGEACGKVCPRQSRMPCMTMSVALTGQRDHVGALTPVPHQPLLLAT